MPRGMPPLGTKFASTVRDATSLTAAFEVWRTQSSGDSRVRSELTPGRLELIYELAYLRTFAEWEGFLEEVSVRHLCGYTSPMYVPNLLIARAPTLFHARRTLAGNRPYVLWHDPQAVQTRVSSHLVGSPVAQVVASSQQHLIWLAAIRHRVAHHSTDAMTKFDQATMGLTGMRVPGARAGRFLRRRHSSGLRIFDWTMSSLENLALQIAP